MSIPETKQLKQWEGDFGKEYTDRNELTPESLDADYTSKYGITRSELNSEFLAGIPKNARILEVGCNVGNQLSALQKAGWNDLWGVEIGDYALEKARRQTTGINLVKSAAQDLPFKNGFFDLVFTSGVLIHIGPEHLPQALDEICRVSKRFVWGFEYYSEKREEINYRGNTDLLWKDDFKKAYLSRHPEFKLVKNRAVKYSESENRDEMFLIEKK
ncbi:MAG: pseudaminic acid biosynthesis-associated methylase [Candidatus Micrarchaeota archaeon]